MADDQPRDASGNSLRQPAAADPWQSWRAWAEGVNRAIERKADIASLNDLIKTTVKHAADAIRKLSEALARERDERARLAQAIGVMFDNVEARMTKLEIGGRPGVPALTDAEQSAMKARLRQALALSLDELAEQRLATTAPAPGRRTTGLSVRGEAYGEVLPPTTTTT